jgi:hypothetical protein
VPESRLAVVGQRALRQGRREAAASREPVVEIAEGRRSARAREAALADAGISRQPVR